MHLHEPERVASFVDEIIQDEGQEALQIERIRSPERHPPAAGSPSRSSADSTSLVGDIEHDAALGLNGKNDDPLHTPTLPSPDDRPDQHVVLDDKLAEGTTVPDPNLVTWDSPDSIENPRNWSYGRRYMVAMTVAMYTLLSPIASSAIAPALPNIAHDLNVTGSTQTNLLLSLFVLAFAIGPMMWSPMSEVFGRRVILQSTNIVFLIFNMSCGFAQTQAQYCVLRFFAGLAGSAPLSIGSGTIADLFEPEDRGKAMSWYSLAPMSGPTLGPIISSWMVTKHVSWRWIHWMWAAFGLLIATLGYFTLPETYQPRILTNKRNRLVKQTGNHDLYTQFSIGAPSVAQRLSKALVRPAIMLSTEVILLLISLAMMLMYGVLYLVLTTFTIVFRETYDESVGIAGLNYVSLFVGFTIGGQVGGRAMDFVYKRLKTRNGGKGQPEHKLPMSIAGGFFLSSGLIIYGWGAEKKVHWMVPNIGAALFSIGSMWCFMSLMNYIVDSYGLYAASGTAGAVFLRSLAGFGFPLFADNLYQTLDLGWGNTMLALIYLVLGVSSSCLFMVYGPYLRSKSPHQSGRKNL